MQCFHRRFVRSRTKDAAVPKIFGIQIFLFLNRKLQSVKVVNGPITSGIFMKSQSMQEQVCLRFDFWTGNIMTLPVAFLVSLQRTSPITTRIKNIANVHFS